MRIKSWYWVIRKLVNSLCRDGANTTDTRVQSSSLRLKVAPKVYCIKRAIFGLFFLLLLLLICSNHFDNKPQSGSNTHCDFKIYHKADPYHST